MPSNESIPVYVQEPNKRETRRLVGRTGADHLPPEFIAMSGWAAMEDLVSTRLGKHDGATAWIIVAMPPAPPKTSSRMNALISFAVGRKCMWLSPWLEGEKLKVWLPNGEVLAYDNGDQTDIDHLDAHLKLRGL